jgi:hypothetical protein
MAAAADAAAIPRIFTNEGIDDGEVIPSHPIH